ncbi:MAG: murein biosynthesis integral membrane protein MurJ [Patescibacteria group bacterium]|nr:murein biosynthesis integral membrane protein MurJ [Patescibacteria group bacterium]
MRGLIAKSKNFLSSSQDTVFSAAGIIMFMIVASKILGLVRNTILLELFPAEEVSLFFAAFRLPDTIFEVLVFGTFSSAFIPVFTKAMKKDKSCAWNVASTVMNWGVVIFGIIGVLVAIFADNIYQIVAPGYTEAQRQIIVDQARILLIAQVFFVASYVLTGVLESLRRFLIPALAPIFYNAGIVLTTYFLAKDFGLMAPTYGVLLGAIAHFAIQLPLAVKLGFRINLKFNITGEVKNIGKLATPRLIETIFIQFSKMVELFLASLVSTASYAYFYLGNTLQSLPVGLFGISIAKAALPTLSDLSDDFSKFRQMLNKLLSHVIFFIVPFAVMMIVLRVPIVRIVYGRELFDWQSTYQTSLVLSAFAVGILSQAGIALLSRAFYALHDTKTPVVVAIITILSIILVNFILIKVLNVDVWGLAASYSFCITFQFVALYVLLFKRLGGIKVVDIIPILQSLFAGIISGFVMFFLLKFFDRSVWIKKISFLGQLDIVQNIPFEIFVLDTRYTNNLLALTFFVSIIGIFTYLLCAFLVGSKEVGSSVSCFLQMVKRKKQKQTLAKDTETITPTSGDSILS